jgi:hypothetical protein
MTTKSTTVKQTPAPVRERVTQEHKLVLPQDVGGFTTNFRREAARSVGRIMTDEKKLKCFLGLLEAFEDYALGRFEKNTELLKKTLSDKAAVLIRERERLVESAATLIDGKRATVAHLAAEIDAHDTEIARIRAQDGDDKNA